MNDRKISTLLSFNLQAVSFLVLFFDSFLLARTNYNFYNFFYFIIAVLRRILSSNIEMLINWWGQFERIFYLFDYFSYVFFHLIFIITFEYKWEKKMISFHLHIEFWQLLCWQHTETLIFRSNLYGKKTKNRKMSIEKHKETEQKTRTLKKIITTN